MVDPELQPAVMVRQVRRLANDLRDLVESIDDQARESAAAWDSVGMVYLTGDGDSYHAASASEYAFSALAGVPAHAVSAMPFLAYTSDRITADARRSLVVGASASGATERVVQALDRARACGATTLAVTCRAGSPLTEVADHSIVVELPDSERSPGIRTYQASLLTMLLVALRLADGRAGTGIDTRAFRRDLLSLADVIDATNADLTDRIEPIAEMVAGAPVVILAGSGPSHGTAMFGAAKLIEGAGIFAMGQDLEEWCHVERFARPGDMPVFVVAPPGHSYRRAIATVEKARSVGRRVVGVVKTGDVEVARHCHAVLPVQGEVCEAFSPLVCHLFASHLAAAAADRLGRRPFQLDLA